MRFTISVRITHQAGDAGPRRLPEPFRAFLDRASREEAESVVEEFWQAAAATGMEPYLRTEITPVRGPSITAAETLPEGGAVLGERLADVINLDTWSQTRLATKRD